MVIDVLTVAAAVICPPDATTAGVVDVVGSLDGVVERAVRAKRRRLDPESSGRRQLRVRHRARQRLASRERHRPIRGARSAEITRHPASQR